MAPWGLFWMSNEFGSLPRANPGIISVLPFVEAKDFSSLKSSVLLARFAPASNQ